MPLEADHRKGRQPTLDEALRLSSLMSEIAASPDFDAVLDKIFSYLDERWGVNVFAIQLVDIKAQLLRPYRLYGLPEEAQGYQNFYFSAIPLQPKTSLAATVALRKVPFYASDEVIRENSDRIPEVDRRALGLVGVRENLVVPVVIQGQSVAVIHFMALGQCFDFSEQDIGEIAQFIRAISGHIQMALKNREIRALQEQQENTIRLVRRISATIELEPLLDLLSYEIQAVAEIDGLLINLFDDEQDRLRTEKIFLPHGFEAIASSYKQQGFPLSNPDVNVECFNHRRVICADREDMHELPRSTQEKFIRWKIHSMAVLPFAIGEEAIGTIMFFSTRSKVSAAAIDSVGQLVPLFFEQIKNATRYARLDSKRGDIEDSASRLERVFSFINKINNIGSLDQVYETILRTFFEMYDFHLGSVLLERDGYLVHECTVVSDEQYRERANKAIKLVVENPIKIEETAGTTASVFIRNCHFCVPNAQKIMHLPMSSTDRQILETLVSSSTFLLVPIRQGKHPIGVMRLVGLAKQIPIDDEDLKFVESLSSIVGTAIGNAKLFTQVESQKNQIADTLSQLQVAQVKVLEAERQRAEAMRHAKEVAEASAKAKSSFLANMSHEIRTPMNAIIGFTEVLARSELNTSQRDYIGKIESSSRSLLGIINDILDLSKIEAGKLDLEHLAFDLQEVLDNITDMFAGKASEKHIDLVVSVANDAPHQLIGDPLRLGQILVNLCNNAIKFTESGEVEVRAVLENRFESALTVHFSVRDTGIGIEQHAIGKLFDSFMQADESTTRRFGGTGLGLSISKFLVELMGGRIWVDSTPGVGSSFNFTASFEAQAVDRQSLVRAFSSLHSKRVGIWSESVSLLRFLHECCDAQSMHAQNFNDWPDLLHDPRMLSRFDALIVDLTHNDDELLQELSLLDDGIRRKLLILVPFGRDDLLDQVRAQGACGVLTKPLKRQDLFESLLVSVGGQRELKAKTKRNRDTEVALDAISGAQILLVEDNPINQQLVFAMLTDQGVTIDVASNGLAALDKLQDASYDIVLMDVQMPIMDGYETTRLLRKQYQFSKLPVIAMTANAMIGDKEKCLAAGMDDYLSKPINRVELIKKIEHWLPEPDKRVSNIQSASLSLAKDTPYSSGLPEKLSVLQIAHAVSIMGGDNELYLQILREFCERYAEAHKELSEILAEGDAISAQRFAHTLKGLASTIGAPDLATLFQRVDKNLRDGKSSVDQELTEISGMLREIVNACQMLTQSEVPDHLN